VANTQGARRYAQAIFEIAQEGEQFDTWLSQLQAVSVALREPRVARFLENPDISFAKKQPIIAQSLKEMHPMVVNFVYLLTQRGRLGLLPQVTSEFERMVNDRRGIQVAEVTTAVPLEPLQVATITRRLEEMTGKKIILHQKVDPQILGGLVARVGDMMIDGSLRGRLEGLRAQIS